MNIDWKKLSNNLSEISGYFEFDFLKSSKIEKNYSDEKVESTDMKSGLDIIRKVLNSDLKQNDTLKKKIKKEIMTDHSNIKKIHEFVVKSNKNTNFIKIVFVNDDESTDLLVLFEDDKTFVLIGINQAHPYIICSDGWSYDNSDGSGFDVYYDKKKKVVVYSCFENNDLVNKPDEIDNDNKEKSDNDEDNEIVQEKCLSEDEFNIFIVNQYKNFCDDYYH